tara:strand:+ start:6826 stop:7095 length:270 start_codon:yes stop_codon:yes gene_type:complete
MSILDSLKDKLGGVAEDVASSAIDEAKKELAKKIDDVFDDELQKMICDAINKNVDIPWVPESVEDKWFNAGYDKVEAIVKPLLKKKILG